MASIQVDHDEQVEEVTKPTTGKPELNSPAIDELEAPAKTTTETSPYFDEDHEQEAHDQVKEDKPEDKDDDEEDDDEDQEKPAASQIIDEDDEDAVEPAFSSGRAISRSGNNEFSEEEDDNDAHDDDIADDN